MDHLNGLFFLHSGQLGPFWAFVDQHWRFLAKNRSFLILHGYPQYCFTVVGLLLVCAFVHRIFSHILPHNFEEFYCSFPPCRRSPKVQTNSQWGFHITPPLRWLVSAHPFGAGPADGCPGHRAGHLLLTLPRPRPAVVDAGDARAVCEVRAAGGQAGPRRSEGGGGVVRPTLQGNGSATASSLRDCLG